MRIRDLVVQPDAVPAYEPPGHTGTVNRRLVPPPGQPMGKLEVVLGVLQPGGQALLHTHTDLDQAIYVLEGGCRVKSAGETAEVGPGQIAYLPAGTPHQVIATGNTALRALVIYAPPLHR
ncbi:MAG TPA: cupin domain-containing protein [Candidatus Methylomirabilis sp.]|jgi:mannose-6-phosphate isomerase-like protein (cupin superfamily)